MSAHRAPRPRHAVRRALIALALAVTTGLGSLVLAAPASAAGPWYVAPTGVNNAACGLAPASPCLTVTFVLAKAAFADGDTINVAPGTYVDKPLFGAKTATVIGSGGGATFSGSNNGFAIGVNIAAAKTLTLQNLTLTQGRPANGVGGALVIAAGNVVTTNVNLVNSASLNVGGGAYVPATNGSLTMNGGTVSGNTAANFGGGLYSQGGAVTLNGTTVQNNSTIAPAGVGGGFAGASVLNATGATFANNTSGNGGAIYNNTGTVTLTNTSLTGNTAGNQGGGIFQQAGTTNLNNTTITGGSAANLAGAVALISGNLSTLGGSVSNNSALNGGAIYNGGSAVIDGTALNGNTANGAAVTNGGNAGAIYNANQVLVKNAIFTGNKVVASTATSPGVSGYGGAILSVPLAAAATPKVTLQNTTINGGAVSGGNAVVGGAIAALGNIGAGGANSEISAIGLTLSENVALAGGGIYTTGKTTLSGGLLDQNRATHSSAGLGGALYAATNGAGQTVTLDGAEVTGNDAAAGGGGLVLAAGVTADVKDGTTISGNTAPIGAGIFNAGALTVTSSHVDDNDASNSGGGIYTGAPVTLIASSVDGNSAAFLGGGLSTTETTGGFTMTGGTVSGNDAFAAGGVFLGNSRPGSFDSTDFVGNTSTGANFGGGAILSAGQLSLNDATLEGNTADGASGSGGAIFSGSSDENVTTTLRITNSALIGNSSFVGSAVYAASSKASSTNKTSISNSTVHANTATGPFGALEALDPMSITHSTITDNTAVPTNPFDAYGGIVAGAAGLVSVSGTILAGNSGRQCNVAVTDGGYNLSHPTSTECAFSAAKNDVFAPAQLSALGNNGGPTQSRLPLGSSPALDKIPASTATGVADAISGAAITLCAGGGDQRGTARPQGARCDIGAVEAAQIAPTVNGPDAFTYTVGSAGAPKLYVTTGSPRPSLTASGLPSGVVLIDNGDGTATISGTPASGTGGVHAVVVTATNEAGNASLDVTLTVNQAPGLNGPSAATFLVGQAGDSGPFSATGHPTPALTSSGGLPGGVGFTDNGDGTGKYTGTPASGAGGTYPLTVTASNGTLPDASRPFTLTVNEAPSLTGPGAVTFTAGTAGASGAYTAGGFPVPAITGSGLPTGLAVTGAGPGTATITGTPGDGTGGVHTVTLTAANGIGSDAVQAVDVTVNESPELTGPSAARFVVGTSNSIGFSSDGFPVASLSVSGALPAGLSFADNGNGSATLGGTATTVGVHTVTVTASNGVAPDASVTVTIEVVPPLDITTTALPNAAYKTAYSSFVTASGGQPAYTFSIVGGALPTGLSMNAAGFVTGSTTANPGTYTFTVKVVDSTAPEPQVDTQVVSIQVVKGSTSLAVTPVVLTASQGLLGLKINIAVLEADLTGGFPVGPVAGQPIVFKAPNGTTVCTANTDADGHVKCQLSLLNALLVPLSGGVSAHYAGNATWNPASGSAGTIG